MTTDIPKRLQKEGDVLDLKGRYFFTVDIDGAHEIYVDGDKIEYRTNNEYAVYNEGVQVGRFFPVRCWKVIRGR